MADFGGYWCDRIIGEPMTQAQELAVWKIVGQNGYGVHLLGGGSSAHHFTLVAYGADFVAVGVLFLPLWLANIRSLQGSIITVTNDQGHAITEQLVVRVQEPRSRTAYNLVNTSRRLEVPVDVLTV